MLATEEVGIESLDLHVAVPLPRKLRVWSSFPGPVREGCSNEIHGVAEASRIRCRSWNMAGCSWRGFQEEEVCDEDNELIL